MLGRIIEALRRRPVLGIGVSVAIHAALIVALVGVKPTPPPVQKRGDALIVELPNLPEPANAGVPGPQPGTAPVPAPPAPKAPPTPPAPPAPPSPPKPRVATPPAPKAPPKEAPREVAPRAMASAPQPPPATERGDIPAAKSAPQAPRETRAAAESPKPEAAAPPAVASPPPSPPGPVAMVPPPDLRSAFRRGGGGIGIGPGGAGGTGVGRGGILGEPVPLDSKDPDFSDYLERIRQLIKQNWGYPCVKNLETRECEYKSARLIVDFGILKHGVVQFVEVQRASGWSIYDDYAVNAIKLASPFPPIPAQLMARRERDSAGLPIRVNFNYQLETGITNVR